MGRQEVLRPDRHATLAAALRRPRLAPSATPAAGLSHARIRNSLLPAGLQRRVGSSLLAAASPRCRAQGFSQQNRPRRLPSLRVSLRQGSEQGRQDASVDAPRGGGDRAGSWSNTGRAQTDASCASAPATPPPPATLSHSGSNHLCFARGPGAQIADSWPSGVSLEAEEQGERQRWQRRVIRHGRGCGTAFRARVHLLEHERCRSAGQASSPPLELHR
jgi:hypothetical protein